MQYPDENPFYPNDKENSYCWLMQVTDGNRLDLTVQTVDYTLQHIQEDMLCKVLLDKEQILPDMEEAPDRQRWVKKPTEEQYHAVCNDFWWRTNNIAKGLWREEFPYVQDMTGQVVRQQLIMMLNWKVGIMTDWSVSTGKSLKYLYRWLPKDEWETFLDTYFDCDVEHAWHSVFEMCSLFERTARYVGAKLGWEYHQDEGKDALSYLESVHQMAKDQ